MLKHLRTLSVLTAGCLCLCLATAQAATIISGTLYFTTFQTQSAGPGTPNVWKVTYNYDSVGGFSISAPAPVASLTGADGISFDPQDSTSGTLLVGEQNSNLVAKLKTDGTILSQVKADSAGGSGVGSGQAYWVTATPDKSKLIVLPNDASPNPNSVNIVPLAAFANGANQPIIAGPDKSLRGLAFKGLIGNPGYYGDALDRLSGHFGTLDTSSWTTTRLTVVDDLASGADVSNALPSHAVVYDSFTGCFILSSGDSLWQVCADLSGNFHVTSKLATSDFLCHSASGSTDACSFDNWDSTLPDGAGHLFGANNNGDMIFVDYSVSQKIGDAGNYSKIVFLQADLDDLVNNTGGGTVTGGGPTGCPATQGYWHKGANWTALSATVDGVVYTGNTCPQTMKIGGISYTRAQLLPVMPSGGLHSGNYANGLSQLIAAVLNIAAGGQHTSAVDAAISADNTALAGFQLFCGSALCTPTPGVLSAITGNLSALDTYNSAVGLLNGAGQACAEASGLSVGNSCKQ